jgi:hypothetical protein
MAIFITERRLEFSSASWELFVVSGALQSLRYTYPSVVEYPENMEPLTGSVVNM